MAQELHKHGVNMRHIGLLRAYVSPPKGEGFGSSAALANGRFSKTSAGMMRDRALVRKCGKGGGGRLLVLLASGRLVEIGS